MSCNFSPFFTNNKIFFWKQSLFSSEHHGWACCDCRNSRTLDLFCSFGDIFLQNFVFQIFFWILDCFFCLPAYWSDLFNMLPVRKMIFSNFGPKAFRVLSAAAKQPLRVPSFRAISLSNTLFEGISYIKSVVFDCLNDIVFWFHFIFRDTVENAISFANNDRWNHCQMAQTTRW